MVNLHNHTQFSALDGLVRVEELLDWAIEHNQPAVAITDHGEMSGIISFILQAEERGIKPIAGYEAYLVEDRKEKKKKEKRMHLTLLAQNEKGYKNLVKISSEAYLTGYNERPRIDWELLGEYSEGIICLSGCLGGVLPLALLGKVEISPEMALKKLWEIFENRLWLEIIPFNVEEQKKVNVGLVDFSQKHKIPFVVTGDLHYLSREDAKIHDLLLAIQTQKRFDDPKRFRFETYDFYFRNDEDFYRDLNYLPKNIIAKALEETEKIAGLIDDSRGFLKNFRILEYPIPDEPDYLGWLKENGLDKNKETYFQFLLDKGIKGKFHKFKDKEDCIRRIRHEYWVIKERDFFDYFLIVRDYVLWAKEMGIAVGPARGSSAGSLIAYLIGITEVNPMEYGLMFERFISPGRKELPDIDMDFQHDMKDRIKEYLMEKYGEERVAQIATYTRMDKRRTIRDVGKALGMDNKKCDHLVEILLKDFPEEITFREALSNKDVYNFWKSEMNKFFGKDTDFFLQSIAKLEGVIRQYGRHAAGIAIADLPIQEICPMRLISGHITTQNDMQDLADIGLLKVDILGVKALTTIQKTISLLKQNRKDFDGNWEEKYLDKNVWDYISSGNCLGLFQLETPGISHLTKRLKPKSIEDLSIVIALYRPGPLKSGLVDKYLKMVTQNLPFSVAVDKMKEILSETHGAMIYQEQVLRVAQEIAGYSSSEADELRKIIGKKLIDKLAEEEKRFKEKMAQAGYSSTVAENLWNDLVEYGGYAFNKSHSISYALLSFQTAYLKYYYPLEYMCALLNVEIENQSLYIEECHRLGIKILPPCVNSSDRYFSIEGNALRCGLLNIKFLGESVIKTIFNNRPYLGLKDFYKKTKLPKDIMEALIGAGAFDSFYRDKNRYRILSDFYLFASKQVDSMPENFKDNLWLDNYYLGGTMDDLCAMANLEKYSQIKNADTWDCLPLNYPVVISGVVKKAKNFLRGKKIRGNFYLFTPWKESIYFLSNFEPEKFEGKPIVLKAEKSERHMFALEAKEIR